MGAAGVVQAELDRLSVVLRPVRNDNRVGVLVLWVQDSVGDHGAVLVDDLVVDVLVAEVLEVDVGFGQHEGRQEGGEEDGYGALHDEDDGVVFARRLCGESCVAGRF